MGTWNCQDERRDAGCWFEPSDEMLTAQKLWAHRLSRQFSQSSEGETALREQLLGELLAHCGDDCYMVGPIFFHYGCHTRIGDRFFANCNLVIQDDGPVTIGNDCNFGPNVTIVTALHPMVAAERRGLPDSTGVRRYVCRAAPVHIGDDCWLGAGVIVCPGVRIGDGCVIGAGAVVTRDIPAGQFAAGNPCRVIRPITEADSVRHSPAFLAGYGWPDDCNTAEAVVE